MAPPSVLPDTAYPGEIIAAADSCYCTASRTGTLADGCEVGRAQASAEAGRAVEKGELINTLMAHFAVGGTSLAELEASLGELLREAATGGDRR